MRDRKGIEWFWKCELKWHSTPPNTKSETNENCCKIEGMNNNENEKKKMKNVKWIKMKIKKEKKNEKFTRNLSLDRKGIKKIF